MTHVTLFPVRMGQLVCRSQCSNINASVHQDFTDRIANIRLTPVLEIRATMEELAKCLKQVALVATVLLVIELIINNKLIIKL